MRIRIRVPKMMGGFGTTTLNSVMVYIFVDFLRKIRYRSQIRDDLKLPTSVPTDVDGAGFEVRVFYNLFWFL
jgi:hypothetical protein